MSTRRPERVYLRVPVLVQGSDVVRGPFSEVTSTVNLSRKGALILLRSDPTPGVGLQVTNLTTMRTANFRVVDRRLRQHDGRSEFGIETDSSSEDFWGIKFEDRPPSTEFSVAGLMLCTKCNRRVFAYMSVDEYRGLSEDFRLQRVCAHCQAITDWTICSSDEGSQDFAAEGPSEETWPEGTGENSKHPYPRSERRAAVRYALKLPIYIIGPGGVSELTVANNFSKTGLMFTCDQQLHVGERVQVIIGYGVAKSPPMIACTVVWRLPREENKRHRYAVRFESSLPAEAGHTTGEKRNPKPTGTPPASRRA